MNEYETLLEKVKGLNRELALSSSSNALAANKEKIWALHHFTTGRQRLTTTPNLGLKKSSKNRRAGLASPSRPGLAMTNDEFIAGLVAVREKMLENRSQFLDSGQGKMIRWEIENCVALVENLLEETRVARP